MMISHRPCAQWLGLEVTRESLSLFLSQVGPDSTCPFVITADLGGPLNLSAFSQARPDRYIDVGVAEQCLVATAAGASTFGTPAIAATFASFALRGVEAFQALVAHDDRHVILVGSHAGLATGPNGPSHQCPDDLGVFSSIPRTVCFSPCDTAQAIRCLEFACSHHGHYYLRLARWAPPVKAKSERSVLTDEWTRTYQPMRGAPSVAILCHGVAYGIAIEVVDGLTDRGVCAMAIHSSLFPFDLHQRLPDCVETVVSIEDHLADSGLGRLVNIAYGDHKRVIALGATWPLGSDDANALYAAAGLTASHILELVDRPV